MQLLLLILLLAAGGEVPRDLKPLLEDALGGDLLTALGEAEQLAEAFQEIKSSVFSADGVNGGQKREEGGGEKDINFPLTAVSSFADDEIMSAFTQYLNAI